MDSFRRTNTEPRYRLVYAGGHHSRQTHTWETIPVLLWGWCRRNDPDLLSHVERVS